MEEGRKRFDIPKPVAVGDVIDVSIEAEGGQGDGIAKVENFVVFVKGAKTGEKCKVKITDVKRTYAVGEKQGPAEAASEPAKEEAPPESATAEAASEPAKEEAPPEEEKE
jgi:predicted RNA-binding protein with TRAM domain